MRWRGKQAASTAWSSRAQNLSSKGLAPAATFQAQTRAVEVDVVVLDSHGDPMKGLHKDDFAITEDGNPQTATFFEEHPAETGGSDVTTCVLLIDTLNTPKEDQSFARRQVAEYLKKMPAGSMCNRRTKHGRRHLSIRPLSNELRHEDSAHAANFAAMNALASGTGGVMLPTSNDLNRMLARAVRDGSQYYTLSYAPTNTKTDGSFRRIEVKLRSGNYQLAYRQGYYATDAVLGITASPAVNTGKAAAAVSSDPLSPLMRSGMAAATEVQYEVRVEPVTPQTPVNAARVGGNLNVKGPMTRYRADFVIHRHTAPSSDATRKDRLQVEVIAYDRSGKVMNWQAGALNLTPADDATAQQKGIRTHMEIDVPRDAVSLATGVYDWSLREAGTREIALGNVALPAAQPAETLASTPAPASVTAPAAQHMPELLPRTPEAVERKVKTDRRIHLDVVVRDGSGQPVSGLQQSEFTVLDDDRAQPLASFRAVDGLTAEPPVEVVLVLDTMNTSFQQMAVVRQGLRGFYGRMAAISLSRFRPFF
jgi:hypothetical protein